MKKYKDIPGDKVPKLQQKIIEKFLYTDENIKDCIEQVLKEYEIQTVKFQKAWEDCRDNHNSYYRIEDDLKIIMRNFNGIPLKDKMYKHYELRNDWFHGDFGGDWYPL